MEKQVIEEGATFELNGVECRILSVGVHTVDGEPAGYSYSFRPVKDLENDENVAAQAEERRQREESELIEARKAEIAAEQAEKAAKENELGSVESSVEAESEISPEGSDEKTTQENSLPVN